MADNRESNARLIDARRRGFLQGAVLGAGAAAAGSALADHDVAGVEPIEPVAPGDGDAGGTGYRVTDHVREYYAKARF